MNPHETPQPIILPPTPPDTPVQTQATPPVEIPPARQASAPQTFHADLTDLIVDIVTNPANF